MKDIQAPRSVTIGGISWRVVEASTIDRDFYMQQKAQAAGVLGPAPNKGESNAEFANRLLYQILGSGHAFELLGGLLMPSQFSDDRWTREEAAKTAEFMRRLTGAEDKQAILSCMVAMLLGFFERALASLRSSGDVSLDPLDGERVPMPQAGTAS